MVRLTSDEKRSYRIKIQYIIYSLFLLSSIFATMIGVLLGRNTSLNSITSFIGVFVLLIVFYFSRGFFKKIMFYLFCLGEGMFLTPFLYHALSIDSDLILKAVIATLLVTLIALVIGFYSNSLSWLGNYLFSLLLGVLALTLLNFIFPIPFISQISALIFTLFIAYDIDYFKTCLIRSGGYLSTDEILDAVMDQFLNILNLFTDFINIFDN